jgi:hypothetical protein
MKRLWDRLRAFLRGPSERDLALDLAIIRRRLDKLEEDWSAEAARLSLDDQKVVRISAALRQRRIRGLEG